MLAMVETWLKVNGPVVLGLVVAIVVSTLVVGPVVRRVGKMLRKDPPPEHPVAKHWMHLNAANPVGPHIGTIEVVLFFGGMYAENGWALIGVWIAMKTAFYWQNTTFSRLPTEWPKDEEQAQYARLLHQLGQHRASTILIGTGGNLLSALLGVAITRSIC